MAYTTIDDPSAYFHTQLYTGDGNSGRTVTNDANAGDFKPDWVWIKKRSGGTARSHNLYDSSRGATQLLNSDNTGAEFSQTAGLTAFGLDGFTLGSDDGVNGNTYPYVAWQWKANGGTTSSNTDGSITSTVQANAGFSIVTYTGNGSNATVGHGLGVKPAFYIIKNRDNTTSNDGRWMVWHQSLEQLHNYYSFLFLHLSNSRSEGTTVVNATPNTTTFALGTDGMVNNSGQDYVAYCFAEKQGYSKFGSYTGNGNADGPMVFCGLKPAWVMIKQTDGTGSWVIHDTKRGTINPIDEDLFANLNSAESDNDIEKDILSNGFKLRTSHSAVNGNGNSYIYLAFASSPFVSSEGVPTTAR